MKPTITCVDIHNQPIETTPDTLRFRPTVYGVLIKEGKLLLSKQFDGYDFPGGGVDIDETLQEACEREFLEETGLTVRALVPVHCYTSFFCPNYSKKYEGQFWNAPIVYFLVEYVGGDLSTDGFTEEEKTYAKLAEWVDLATADRLKYINSSDNPLIIRSAKALYERR